MRRRYLLLHFFILITLAASCGVKPAEAGDGEAKINTSLDRNVVLIGDRMRYAIEARSRRPIEFEFPAFKDDKIGEFEIKESGRISKRPIFGGAISGAWYEIAGYVPGQHIIPQFDFKYRVKGEKEWHAAKSGELKATITSVLPAGGRVSDIKDIKGPIAFREIRLLHAALAAFLVLFCAGAYLLYRKLRSRRPIKLPHETALEELESIRGSFLQSGDVKEYFTRASDCVRYYIERRFNCKAPEMTTEEFLNSLKGPSVLSVENRRLLETFLTACDLVKFAKYSPTNEEVDSVYASARRFVEETKEEAPK